MIVNSLITNVTSYFTSTSVPAIIGEGKIQLIVADDDKKQTEEILEIDSASNFKALYTATPIAVPAETKKVYIDGAIVKPVVINITGVIENSKISRIQDLADAETWMYISHARGMGGSISKVGVYTNSKLFYITSLSVEDTGFSNTVGVQITLSEVVLYDYELTYKYGVKQTNKISGSGTSSTVSTEKTYSALNGITEEDGAIDVILKTGKGIILR